MTTTAPPRRAGALGAGRRLRLAAFIALGFASVAGLAIACTPGGTPPAGSTAAPSVASGDSPKPRPTSWPTTTVEAAIALGAADGDFTKMAADVVAAVGSEDPGQILTVMNRALEFLTENQKNIPRLRAYDATRGVGDRLADAYATMIEGATTTRDGLMAGDGSAVETGLATFFDGNAAYVAVSPELGDLAEQAIFMKRQLLR